VGSDDDDVISLLDSATADDVMSTLALSPPTATAAHQHFTTFDPGQSQPDLLSHTTDQKHGKLGLTLNRSF